MAIVHGGISLWCSVSTILCHDAELKAFATSTVVISFVASIVDLPSRNPNYQSDRPPRFSSSSSNLVLIRCSYSLPKQSSRQMGLSFVLSTDLAFGISTSLALFHSSGNRAAAKSPFMRLRTVRGTASVNKFISPM
jgi:hypothetical protein